MSFDGKKEEIVEHKEGEGDSSGVVQGSTTEKPERKVSPTCTYFSALFNGAWKFVDVLGGLFAKTALTYILIRFFYSEEGLDNLGKDLRQFWPLMTGEFFNALTQSIGMVVSTAQLIYKSCGPQGSTNGCCSDSSVCDFFATKNKTKELWKDFIMRVLKLASIIFVLNATVTSTVFGKEGFFFRERNNAKNFMVGAGISIINSGIDIGWSALYTAFCKDLPKLVGGEDAKKMTCHEKFWKTAYDGFKKHGCDDFGAGFLIAGLACILSDKVKVGTLLMRVAAVGYGASVLKDLGVQGCNIYKACKEQMHVDESLNDYQPIQ